MNLLKRVLYQILGVKAYLSLVSFSFFWAYRLGILKRNRNYHCHYLVKNFINENDVVIDLGANLGYYSVIFSKLVKTNGQVFSIEPVELYRSVLSRNLKRRKNVKILPYAIGPDDGAQIKMGVPIFSAYFSHGRTHVLTEEEECEMVFDATTKRPDVLFKDLKKLDYLKCDIEGFERIAIPLFDSILRKFKPILQIEVGQENKDELVRYLRDLKYDVFEVKDQNIYLLKGSTLEAFGDLIFISKDKIAEYKNLIKE